MKQIFLYLLILLFQSIIAQTPEEYFKQGNIAYKNADYQLAVQKYEKAINPDKESGTLYFNLANAYYKLNKIAPSVYYYEKALKLNPDDEDILHNLKLAQQMKIDKIKKVPVGLIEKINRKIAETFSTHIWGILAVVWAFLGLGFFILFLFSSKSNLKRIGFVMMFLSLFVFLFSWHNAGISHKISFEKYAIIFTDNTTLQAEPNLTSDKITNLHEGTKIKLLKKENNWQLIKLSDGKKGWVPTNDFRIIE